MTIFELCIDGKLHHVRSTDSMLRRKMYEYIKRELAAGRKLSEITYCWVPLQITRIPEDQ